MRFTKTIVFAAMLMAAAFLPVQSGAATPKDMLVVGVASDPSGLDPAVSSDNYDWRQTYPAYDRLVKYKVIDGVGSTEVEPMLAESWTVSEDGLEWTFKLRQGVTFTDGSPVDAAAVKFSFDRCIKIGMGPGGNLESVDSVEVVDPYTVKFKLKMAFAPFLQILAVNGSSVVNPKVMEHEKDGDMGRAWLSQHSEGSGPYIVKEWVHGERLIMEARQGYWGGEPKIKRIFIRPMREASDRRRALEKGDIDIAEAMLVDQIPALEAAKDVTVRQYDGQDVNYVYINTTKPALDNKLVRQALSYAVDYKGMIESVMQGQAKQLRGPIPEGMWGHDPEAFMFSYDPAKAKALLKEAGYEKGLKLTLIYSERRAYWEQIAAILQSNLADIGVELKLELMANATLRERVAAKDYELCLGAWSPDFADPYMFANFWYESQFHGMAGNRAFYTSEAADALLKKATVSPDHEERVQLYKEAQKLVIEDAPYILLFQSKTVVPMRSSVKGYVFNPMLESMYNFEAMYKE